MPPKAIYFDLIVLCNQLEGIFVLSSRVYINSLHGYKTSTEYQLTRIVNATNIPPVAMFGIICTYKHFALQTLHARPIFVK